jgi:hypothetical protein
VSKINNIVINDKFIFLIIFKIKIIMKNIFTLFLFLISSIVTTYSQCPYITGAMINACGSQEGTNEFITFNTGGASMNATDFQFSYSSSNPPPFSGSATLFIDGGAGGTVFSSNPGITLTGCSTIEVTASTIIPANSSVIMMYSSSTLTEFDLSTQCSNGIVYVMFINTANTSAADGWSDTGNFANNPASGSLRYLNITNTASPCSGADNVVSYQGTAIQSWGSNVDGNAILWDETGTPDYVNGGCNSISMPVEFSKFLATAIKNTSILSFATASETNNDFFTIERSADGTSFDAIGEIKGAGNSNTTLSYEFTDKKPFAGVNYYRIKQTDYDGKFSYTDIKSVRHNMYGNLSITPRTTEGRLQITTDAEDYTLDVYNVAGQQVKSYPSLSLDQSISIDELTAGLYYIKVNVGGQVETTKIVKL